MLPSFTNAMATLEPALLETDMRALVSNSLRLAPHRSLIVLFTGLDARPVEEGLLPVLPLLTKRHEVVLASVADPRLDELATARGTVQDVYGAAAAEQTRADRRRTAERLTRLGVTVLDAPPAALPPPWPTPTSPSRRPAASDRHPHRTPHQRPPHRDSGLWLKEWGWPKPAR